MLVLIGDPSATIVTKALGYRDIDGDRRYSQR